MSLTGHAFSDRVCRAQTVEAECFLCRSARCSWLPCACSGLGPTTPTQIRDD